MSGYGVMPLGSPLYGKVEVRYSDALVIAAAFELPERPAELPPSLEGRPGGLGVVVFADYPESTIGPYREVVVLVPGVFNGEDVAFCPRIYVTTDVALCQGREIWGFPKKMADIEVTATLGGAVSARLSRGGQVLCSIEGEVADPLDTASARSMLDTRVVNHKVVPAVDGRGLDVDLLSAVEISAEVHEAFASSAVLRCAGEVAEVTGEERSAMVMAARCDMLLPAGVVLERFASVAVGSEEM
ncbi:MAG: acetoacetate decarboxylase family protein [Acidimicrobiales bacterium]